MRITSITVRNYRIHRELRVELDPSRTVIGGLNETGKSTLVEAAHRALFLKARITGETQKNMVSKVHAGQPEVEVSFEAADRSYRILKRFSGTSGTSTLTEVGSSTWQGDEAESRLAEILGVETTGGGRGAGERVAQQWAHLWVWQGEAGDDPAEHANAQKDALLERLQGQGGAAAMQSDRDARVAQVFAEQTAKVFTKGGDPKKESELGRAMEEAASAREAEAQARASFERLEKALGDFQSAETELRSCQSNLEKLRPELDAVDAKLARVSALRADEGIQDLAAKATAGNHGALAQANDQILRLRKDIERHGAALAPKETEASRLKNRVSERADEQKKAEDAYEKGTAAADVLRLRLELAAAHVGCFEKRDQRDKLRVKLEEVRKLKKGMSELESDLAKLPSIDARRLKSIEKLEGERSSAEAALKGMAAGIEVIASDAVVKAGSIRLNVGDSQVVTEDTEVSVGSKVRLRIKPGGGTGLVDARKQARDRQDSLKKSLDELGIASVEKAGEVVNRRRHLEKEIAALQGRLEGLGAEGIEREFSDAERACVAAEAEVKRRTSSGAGFTPPSTLSEAQSRVAEVRTQAAEADRRVSSLKAAWQSATRAAKNATEALAEHQKELDRERKELTDAEAQHRLLLTTHGKDGERTGKLDALLKASTEADQRLSATRKELTELQPELIEKDQVRLRRAIEQQEKRRADAEIKRAEARTLLQSDGTQDPQAAQAMARGQMQSATDRLTSVKRRADAVHLLHQLFLDEQKRLADRFTQPLAEKITGYLQCLFGAGSRVAVRLENGAFGSLEFTRNGQGGGAFPFNTLSGGAKEQVAAAVRLAMAEVLAEDHEGCLPVVFDDAFAYSDPERVQTLQRMLDHAAGQGLQVIVLTCNPSDYAALGARQVSLSATSGSPLPPTGYPSTGASEPAGSSGDNEASDPPSISVEGEISMPASPRRLSAEGRARIVAAQKARWAKQKPTN